MIGHRLANHHLQILGNGLANPWPIILSSSRANLIYRWILSQKLLATDGQSFFTQDWRSIGLTLTEAKMIGHWWPIIFYSRLTVYRTHSDGSKNDWPLIGQTFTEYLWDGQYAANHFCFCRSESYRPTILSKKLLATAGQSFLTQESPIYMVRSAVSKNDWPLMANHFLLKIGGL